MSIDIEVKKIEQQLKQFAQKLGQLNLKNNDFLQQNQQLALQIVELRNKVNKKKHIIQQQSKDKMIIHQKLVKAEKLKEALQIQSQSSKECPGELSGHHGKQKQYKKEQQNVNLHQLQQKQSKKQESINNKQQFHKNEQKHIQVNSTEYSNTDKGQYEPPLLFSQSVEDNQQQNEDEDQQDAAQMLQKLRATLQENNQDQND